MASCARYLRVKCGVRSQEEMCAGPTLKFRERSRFIKSLKLGLALSVKAFNQIAVTVPLCVVQ
eukprot:2996319-Pyramimonas_sp.AAC.3